MKKTIEELKKEPLSCPWGNSEDGKCNGACMALTSIDTNLTVPDVPEKMECALTLSALSTPPVFCHSPNIIPPFMDTSLSGDTGAKKP